MRRLMAAAAALLVSLALMLTARPASAATYTDIRIADAAHWAATQAGSPYAYGGTGPYWSGYDCSGLVYAAYRRYGFALPRTTYEMLASWHLYRVYSPRRGDLAFYGTGHVEILTGTWGVTFGELHSGTVAGYHRWNSYWHPSAFYRVR